MKLKSLFGKIIPESKRSSVPTSGTPESITCADESRLVHITVVPTCTVLFVSLKHFVSTHDGFTFPNKISMLYSSAYAMPIPTPSNTIRKIIPFIDTIIKNPDVINILIVLFDRIAKFDLEMRDAVIILVIIIAIWASFSALNELGRDEDCGSYGNSKARYPNGICGDYMERIKFMDNYEEHRFDSKLRIFTFELLYMSKNIFGDYRIIPFISSGFLLVISFFLTNKLVGRNYSGFITIAYVLQSSIFWKYDVSMTYPNFWATLLLFSFYSTLKVWSLSPMSFMLSIPVKILSLLNFPALVIFAFLTKADQWKKIIVTYAIIIIGLATIIISSSLIYRELWDDVYNIFLYQFDFKPIDFLWWIGMWSVELASDRLSIIMIFILLPCLFFLKKGKIRNASAILAVIIVFILQPAFIAGFTKYTNEDYRYIHLIVFIGIGIAMAVANINVIQSIAVKHFSLKKRIK